MEILNPAENFEPSREVKKLFAHAPKHFDRIAGIAVHGLFSIYRYDKCVSAVAGVLAIELLTLYIFYINTAGYFAVAVIGAFAVVDFLLAVASHHRHDEVIIKQSEIAVTDDTVVVQAKDKELRALTRPRKIFTFLIWLIAVCKGLGFFFTYGAFDGIVCLVAALYLLEAYLHATFTGYVWYVSIFRYRFKKEHDAFVKSDRHQFAFDPVKPRQHLIVSEIALKNTRQGKQSLERQEESNRYYLRAFGILTDAELLNLVNDQDTSDQRRVLLTEGIKFQLEILKLDPLAN